MENDWKRCLCESKKEKNAFITWSSSSYTKLSWLLTMQNNKKVLEKVLKRRGIQRFSKKVQT